MFFTKFPPKKCVAAVTVPPGEHMNFDVLPGRYERSNVAGKFVLIHGIFCGWGAMPLSATLRDVSCKHRVPTLTGIFY